MIFKLIANVTISVYTQVEANTLEEAVEIAKERELMGITQTGCDTEQDTWLCDELDGIPQNIFQV
jgi:predicted phage gp36 major capsid-like protein